MPGNLLEQYEIGTDKWSTNGQQDKTSFGSRSVDLDSKIKDSSVKLEGKWANQWEAAQNWTPHNQRGI